MSKVLHFDLDTSFVKIKEIMRDKDFLEMEFWAISDAYPNRNKSHFPSGTFMPNIKKGRFYNKPILGKFNNVTDNYETHVYKKKYDPELDMEYYDYEDGGERPLGLIRESDNVRVETDKDGLHWIVFTAVLWVKYNYRGVKRILKSKNGKVSVEVTVLESHEDENGVEIFDDWVFDGITILGYRPNTKVPVQEGIPNAHLTINDLMAEKTFSNQLKTLCFAYEELNDNDMKESYSHLYKPDKNKETEGCIMSYTDKKNAFESILSTFVKEDNSNVNVHVYDFNDTTVFFSFDNVDYKSEYTLNDGDIAIDFENKIVLNEEEVKQFKEKEEPTDDSKECKMGCNKDGQEGEKEDNQCGKVGCDDDCDGKCGDGCDDNNDDDNKNPDDDHDDNCGNFQEDCKKFSLNDELFTGEELVNKYLVDMEQKTTEYAELKKNYDQLMETNVVLEEKVKKYEAQEAKEKMQAFCEEVSNIAKKEGFDEKEIEALMEKCQKGEFADMKDAIKEIAYISFTKKNDCEKDGCNEKSTEFSAKANEPKRDNLNKVKTKKSSFENLQNFINN